MSTIVRKLNRKKSIKENINDIINEDGLLLSKIPLLDYSTLKKLRGLQPSSELYEYKYSNDAMLIAELKKVVAPKKDKTNESSSKENESKVNSSLSNFLLFSKIKFSSKVLKLIFPFITPKK